MSGGSGPFVYRGAGSKLKNKKPCQKEACNIQWCLARRNHDQKKCQEFVDAWKACEERMKAQADADAAGGANAQG